MAVITKGIELYWVDLLNSDGASSGDKNFITFTEVEGKGILLPGLQEIGDLTHAQGSGRDQIEITTLADDKHVYTDGLIADDGNEGIEFKFLFEPKLYDGFVRENKTQRNEGFITKWALYIPTGANAFSKFDILANCSAKVDGAGVNSAMTMTVTLTPTEPITFIPNETATVAE